MMLSCCGRAAMQCSRLRSIRHEEDRVNMKKYVKGYVFDLLLFLVLVTVL